MPQATRRGASACMSARWHSTRGSRTRCITWVSPAARCDKLWVLNARMVISGICDSCTTVSTWRLKHCWERQLTKPGTAVDVNTEFESAGGPVGSRHLRLRDGCAAEPLLRRGVPPKLKTVTHARDPGVADSTLPLFLAFFCRAVSACSRHSKSRQGWGVLQSLHGS